MKRILLVGGGGHCHSVLDTVLSLEAYEKIGVVAKDEQNLILLQNDPMIAPYLVGTDADLAALFSAGWKEAFVTLGSVGNPAGRKKIYADIRKIGFHVPVIQDKSAVVSRFSFLEDGSFIGKNAVVNAGSRIGACSIVNTGAIVEHDCRIGAFSHISPGVVLCGTVGIEEEAHIGAGSVVKQGITVGRGSMIGLGSVVVKNIPENVTAYGNPCKVVEHP